MVKALHFSQMKSKADTKWEISVRVFHSAFAGV